MKFDLNEEGINYIKINYVDKEMFPHYIKAAIRFIGDVELLVSAKAENSISIPVPQTVELGIACDNGLYKAQTLLKSIRCDDGYILFTLKKPDDMEFQQNREYFRVKSQENVNISYEKDGQQESLSSLTYDLSAKGVRIELEQEMDIPEEVLVSLYFQNKTIEVRAKYVRTDVEDNIIKASFQFVDINQADIDYLSQICFKKQLEERRKNLL